MPQEMGLAVKLRPYQLINLFLAIAIDYMYIIRFLTSNAGLCSGVRRASDSRARGPWFNTWSSHILSFLLPLVQEGQLSVTGKSICKKYWLNP